MKQGSKFFEQGSKIPNFDLAVFGSEVVMRQATVITIRTLLCADVRASLNLGQTHAKCVRDSGTASEQCGQIGDLAILIRFRTSDTL